MEGEEIFVELADTIDKLERREWKVNALTCPRTWATVNERGFKTKQGTLLQGGRGAHCIGR